MGWLDGWRLLTGELQRTRFENDVLRSELAVTDQVAKDWPWPWPFASAHWLWR